MTFVKSLRMGALWAVMVLGGSASLQAHAQWGSSVDDFHDKLVQLGSGPVGGSFDPIANTLWGLVNGATSGGNTSAPNVAVSPVSISKLAIGSRFIQDKT